jgi:hypothetical protein
MHRIRAIATLAVALAALALPAAAFASSDDVIHDCSDNGKFDRQHSRQDLKDAKGNLPADINEYTGCKDMIAKALATGSRGSSDGPGGGPGGSGGAGPSSDPGATTQSGATGGSAADVASLKTDTEQAKRSRPSIVAGGRTVAPASSGLNDVAGAANALPASLIVAIALLAGLCAVGGAVVARRRWPDLVRAPLRLIRR